MIKFRIPVRNEYSVLPISLTGSAWLFSACRWAVINNAIEMAESRVEASRRMAETFPYAEVYEYTYEYYEYKNVVGIWGTAAIVLFVLLIALFIIDWFNLFPKIKQFIES